MRPTTRSPADALDAPAPIETFPWEEQPARASAAQELADHQQRDGVTDLTLVALRDDFVQAFNDRDLDGLLALCRPDVECPDLHGDGTAVLAEEVTAVWERSPDAVLTWGLEDDQPCAVAWLPDEDGCWSRAAVVRLEAMGEGLALVAVCDDATSPELVEAEEPVGGEVDSWSHAWSEAAPDD